MTGIATDDYDVVVVGGGQAGLAIGYYLAEQGRKFTILEATSEPAAVWRARWDSLKLFTPARYDSLPGLDFPGDPDSYPMRDDVVRYLADYARHFDLPVELNSPVQAVRRIGEGYVVEVEGGRTYRAAHVVVATGPFQVPNVPSVAHDLDPALVQYHSTNYRSPEDVPAGVVLIVGGGNTGFQIGEELARSHEVHLAIGSKQAALPQRILGRDIFRYLDGTGLIRKPISSRIGQRMRERDPVLIGSSPRAAVRLGIKLEARVVQTAGREISFSDGSKLTVDSVIWATGFKPAHSWVEVPVFDDDGRVKQHRGVTTSDGLYFLGLAWQHTRGSALLGWIKEDAAYIAEQIAHAAGDTVERAAAGVAR
jgi:putative flavoprotein involved in K+ transport